MQNISKNRFHLKITVIPLKKLCNDEDSLYFLQTYSKIENIIAATITTENVNNYFQKLTKIDECKPYFEKFSGIVPFLNDSLISEGIAGPKVNPIGLEF